MIVYGKCECFVMQTCGMFVSCLNPVPVLSAEF